LRLKNNLRFSMGLTLPQRFLGALVAVLIPLIFCLGLLKQNVLQSHSGTPNKVLQLQFLTEYSGSPLHQVLEKPTRNSTEATGSFRAVVNNLVEKNRILVDKNVTANMLQPAERSVSVEQVVVEDIAVSKNQSTELSVGPLAQQFKGKSAITAYQDARSDIQKMADRRAISLQAQHQTKYDVFQDAASNAAIPDCMAHGTTTKLGLDSIKGLLVIPALAAAAAMGKCK